ncbi:hypothetical protein GR223_23700 [Rhizobium leguminosarum]|uniref:hypothetical protein n=1 Tax=Rhizobium ruizarguesonis TaxID=2081791 RepID=UPI0013DE99A1|nr:hypothetical protein [Rhizobium ruizarguesonis]NEJ88898.1 hypothetical protein [Rhizobium ruizarguesonis]
MAYFSIGLEMAATIYIQALSLSEAQTKLECVLSKTIDARDNRWFSGAHFGSENLPEITFATAMTILQPVRGETCRSLDLHEVSQVMRSARESRKSDVVPGSLDCFGEGVTPIFWVDLHVRTIGIVKAEFHNEAQTFLASMDTPAVHWECADHWFELEGLESEFPLILSPNISILGIADGCELTLRWSGDDNNLGTMDDADVGVAPFAMATEAELERLARHLKVEFQTRAESFSQMADEDAYEIAAVLIDYRNRKQAKGEWPPGSLISLT